MKILILGGTRFLGIHLVNEAIAKGHEVTFFHRGKTNVNFQGKVEELFGDRDGNLKALENRNWDAVIDTCGYLPRIVEQSAYLLQNTCSKYVFISSISVYDNFSISNLDEFAPTGTLDNPSIEEINGATYGPLKALCEQKVVEYFPNKALIIRPGLIVGPYDFTDRFTYWPERILRGGEVLAPGKPQNLVQFIDVRDLSVFILRLIESKKMGIYNATGPSHNLTMQAFLESCIDVLGADAHLIWLNDEFLDGKVESWTELPLYLNGYLNMRGMMEVNINKALKAGIIFRPLEETIIDTLKWSALDGNRIRNAGLSTEKETSLIKMWQSENCGG